MAFIPQLTTTDWNIEWQAMQVCRQHSDNASEWDARAKTFPVKHGAQTGYVEQFIKLANLLPHESVFDMGCGTGALATPLAMAGHPVLACDFSQGMLNAMLEDQKSLGVTGITSKCMSWDDDWKSFGLYPKCVDVAIASRSIASYDLKSALIKLNSVAKRRVCITLPCGLTPKIDEKLMEVAGVEWRLGRDFLYAFNILAGLGIQVEVAYIPNTREEYFASPESALVGYENILKAGLFGLYEEEELNELQLNSKLKAWLSEELIFDKDRNEWRLRESRKVSWAFLSWNC